MPYIVTKNGKRRVRADVMVNGERKTKIFPDASKKSQRAAATWEEETRNQLVEQPQTPTVSLTLGSWVNDYLDYVQRRGMSKLVYKEKKSAFKRLAAHKVDGQHPFTIETPVESITKFSVKRHFDQMVDAGRTGNAVIRDRKNLGAAWSWGKANIADWPSGENPFLAVPSQNYPRTKKPRYVPPAEDFWKLHDWLKGRAELKDPSQVQDYAMFMVALQLAARRGEMFRMKRDDLDFSKNLVRLWTRKRKDGVMEYDWLPMTKELRSVLLRWLEIRGSLPGISANNVFVCVDKTAFCDEHYGKPFTNRQHAMRRWCNKVGIKPFGWHGIRHFTASTIFNKGYPIAHIQTILRHQNPYTTERYLRSQGLVHVREALEQGLKREGKVIPFRKEGEAAAG